jgi:hypothetical protein
MLLDLLHLRAGINEMREGDSFGIITVSGSAKIGKGVARLKFCTTGTGGEGSGGP